MLSGFGDTILNLGTDPEKPISKFRFFLYDVIKFFAFRGALLSWGILTVVKGKQKKNVNMLCCNHTTMLDVLASAGTGVKYTIAKAGIAKNPIFGPTITVTRSLLARSNSKETTALMNRRFKEPGWPPLGVFPAGTTTENNILPRFRTGTFYGKPTVQLMTMKYYSYRDLSYCHGSGFDMIKQLLLNPFALIVVTYHDIVL